MNLKDRVKRLSEIRLKAKFEKKVREALTRELKSANRTYLKHVTENQIVDFLKTVPLINENRPGMTYMENWQNVNWNQIHKTLYTKQCLIYESTKKGNEIKEIQSLQEELLTLPENIILSVRKSTSDASGKRTAGVDGVASLTPRQKLALAATIEINGRTGLIKRVYIPKPGTSEKRPLGIPNMEDRVKQNMVKTALEPEWEAKFESGSYGFRPGRKPADAIRAIWNSLRNAEKWVLDTDIEKCFDRISHEYLLMKLGFPKNSTIHKQIKSWLQAGVLEPRNAPKAFAQKAYGGLGTPQGGVISPLLANIALQGIIEHTRERVEQKYGKQAARKYMHMYVYADDLVVMASKKEHIITAQEAIQEFLNNVGLKLK